jgi:excisionase family DNA binding protein
MDNNSNTRGSISPFTVYTVDEAAALLRVNKKEVYRLQAESRLPKNKVGKGYKFLGEDLLRFMGSASVVSIINSDPK